jgi:hypothetical protein
MILMADSYFLVGVIREVLTSSHNGLIRRRQTKTGQLRLARSREKDIRKQGLKNTLTY